MKKLVALILTLVMVLPVFALPASAHYDFENVPHNSPLKHKNLMVVYMDDGVDIKKVGKEEMMTVSEMEDIMSKEETLENFPDGRSVESGRIAFIESRRVYAEEGTEAPLHVTFRVWGTSERIVMVFYKADDAEEWTLLACHLGCDMEVEFPGEGLYGIGAAW